MSDKRRGLGRGLGALIPSAPPQRPGADRPVDVFFPERDRGFTGNTTDPHDDAPAPDGDPGRAADGAATDPQGPDERDVTGGDVRESSAEADHASTESTAAQTVGEDPGKDPTRTDDDIAATAARAADPDGRAGEGTDSRAGATGQAGEADGLVPVPGVYFAEILIDQIVPNPRQPRQVFDPEALAELVHSIREIGVLQPIVVRRVSTETGGSDQSLDTEAPTNGESGPRFELVMGERRWRASQQAGLDRIPAIVRDTQDDDLLRDALLENLHRSQLNPLEEAAAYQQLLDDFGCTHDELAQRIGRSRPQISNTLRLMKLPPLVQRRVAAGVLSAGHARALLGLSDPAAIERLAQRIVAEGLSVRSTEEVVALGGGDDADGRPARRSARPGDRHAALDELASRLSDRFDTRVKIALGQRKGKLTVEFATVEDLNRIVGVLAPEERGVFRG